MILFDNTMLSALFSGEESALKAKADMVVDETRSSIIIPTPALCECLARAGKAGDEIIATLRASTNFRIVGFGLRAAIECAELIASAKSKSDKKHEGTTWAKAKFDWQIIAIAIAESVKTIYSDDRDLAAPADRANIKIVRFSDIKLAGKRAQRSLPLKVPK